MPLSSALMLYLYMVVIFVLGYFLGRNDQDPWSPA